jgi:hypothetical protein
MSFREEWVPRGATLKPISQEALMPTQQLALLANILNSAKPDWVLFTIASLALTTPVSGGESTWDMANRICDRYFSDTPGQNRPMANKAV